MEFIREFQIESGLTILDNVSREQALFEKVNELNSIYGSKFEWLANENWYITFMTMYEFEQKA